MKICMIVFSPSGHTLRVAESMKNTMENKGINVQLLNITGKRQVFCEAKLKEYLDAKVLPHDVLCIGGPVYAGHLESNAKQIIKSLPGVDKRWGEIAIPFVTYGGLHSSIALKEAGDLLYKSGRKNVMGVKIACFHTLTATFDKQVNQGKPGIEADAVIAELVYRLLAFKEKNKIEDVRKSFSYASIKEKIIFNLLSQDSFHKKYRITAIDSDKCTGCGLCMQGCPVNIIKIIDKKATVSDANRCILCAECFHKCPAKAVQYAYYNKVKSRLEKANIENISVYESPQSAVYPIQTLK